MKLTINLKIHNHFLKLVRKKHKYNKNNKIQKI